jgi:hypothetical protein
MRVETTLIIACEPKPFLLETISPARKLHSDAVWEETQIAAELFALAHK